MYVFEQYKWHGARTTEQLAKEKYLASEQLATAVNTALAAEQPLLVMGESGTGKTKLAKSIADQLGYNLISFYTRSDHQARDLLYQFDHIRRFYDAQANGQGVNQLLDYVTFAGIGKAIKEAERCVVLVDEIDKAPRDLPNDLLDIVESNRFTVAEMKNQEFSTKQPPIIVITSNNERQLPEPFLRRCVFHHIAFPDRRQLEMILRTHFGTELSDALAKVAIEKFEEMRARPLEKPPATSELIKWTLVLVRAGVPEAKLKVPLAELPHLGALLKTPQDLTSIQA